MADSVSVTKRTWYGSRVGSSFKKIFSGILLVLVSIALLAWNENNFVEQKAALNEGSKIVEETSSETINPALDQKLVHLDGVTSSPDEQLQDSVFWVKTEDLKLARNVEMYQWTESSSEECHDNVWGSEDCTTTYDYKKKWKDEVIDSSRFYETAGHNNPTAMEFESELQEKSPIQIRAFTLWEAFVDQLDDYETLPLQDQKLTFPWQESVAQVNVPEPEITAWSGEVLVSSWTEASLSGEDTSTEANNQASQKVERFHLMGNTIYVGEDPANPKVGDLKITFSTVKAWMTSIVGKQNGNEISPYKTSNNRSIALLGKGKVSAEEMFANAHAANRMMTWILRLVGLFLMYLGFSMMFDFIVTLAKVLPFLASIIGVGTSFVAFGLTIILGLGTIAIARVVVRPMVGIPLLILAVGGGVGFFMWKKKDKKTGVVSTNNS